eukprot:1160265-Pelagomonas_calceolata.AAC.7
MSIFIAIQSNKRVASKIHTPGEIENLSAAGIPDDSQDLVISNCVMTPRMSSPQNCVVGSSQDVFVSNYDGSDKAAVLREVYRVLAPGGEMYFSDIYCDRRLPQEVARSPHSIDVLCMM